MLDKIFAFDTIQFSFAAEPWLIILGAVLFILYAIYIYKNTIPVVSPLLRWFLIVLRTLALILILFLIFEPILVLKSSEKLKPVNMIFIDNSSSILAKERDKRIQNINTTVSQILENSKAENEIFTFGRKTKNLKKDQLPNLKYNESLTNFDSIFAFIENSDKNISSVIILSDGVLTDGRNPIYTAEKIDRHVYTIGIGDTVSGNDIEIKKVLYNEYIYAGKKTELNITVLNSGYERRTVNISLFEGSKLIEQKPQALGNTGIDKIKFDYMPTEPGENKITVTVSEFKNELTTANNKNVFFINVLDNKLVVLLIAGAPSNDLSFIKNSLSQDENLEVRSITQISANRFLEDNNFDARIDSADILYLIGFPVQNTPANLYNKVSVAIKDKGKPYFLLSTPETSLLKLQSISDELPFSVSRVINTSSSVQTEVTDLNNPLLSNNSVDGIAEWINLPPVLRNDSQIKAKPESNVILKSRIRNIPVDSPLLISRKIGNRRSIALLAGDIWRWKLQIAQKKNNLFDSFILNSVKWLNVQSEQKQIDIKTTKKIVTLGEPVEFIGNVYDETFSPLDDAEVKVNIKTQDRQFELMMNSIGNGIYEGEFQTNQSGDYQFSGEAKLDGKILGKDTGKFSVGDVNVEMLNPRMDRTFLEQIANSTDGKFFPVNNIDGLLNELDRTYEKSIKVKTSESSINLWSNEILLFTIIVLFGIEWFFRKRSGML
ncbi:MAG: hypothetical protein V1720_02735 [bacterium]